jgi:hypothetical protein
MTEANQKYISIRDLTLLDVMLPENNIKEGLSCSYLRAVANVAGYPIQFKETDFGIDATITELLERDSGRTFDSGKNLQIQLKSTTLGKIRETDTEIIYDLSNKTYNDLAYKGVLSPRILVLLVMPEERENWLTHNIEMLILKKCAYWTYLYGLPERQNEASTTAVHINKSRTFCPDSLKAIMDKVSKHGDLNEL